MKTQAFLTAVLAALMLAGCVTETKKSGPLVWNEEDHADRNRRAAKAADPATLPPDAPQATRKRVPGEGETVEIPEEVMAELMRFVNRVQLVVADRIEVDASRIPFQVAMVPLADPNFVETVEMASPELKATGILLRSRAEVPLVESDFCRLRIGDGVDLVAGREIQVRTYNAVDPDRPAFLKVKARGHAVYSDPATGHRREGSAVVMECEIVREDGRLVFHRRIR